MDGFQLDQIVNMADAINKYGALVIGLAIFMIIGLTAVFLIFSRNKKLNSDKDNDFSMLFSEMQRQNQEIFGELIKSAFKPAQPELVPEGITAASAVQAQLRQVAAVTKADRVSIYAFHNGSRMMNGRHMIKVSCWAEFVMLAQFMCIAKHKDTQVSQIQDMCTALLKDHHWEAATEDDIKESQFSNWTCNLGTKSAFAEAVYSADGIIIGFVLIEYILTPIEATWIPRTEEELKKLSDKVSIVLDIELK